MGFQSSLSSLNETAVLSREKLENALIRLAVFQFKDSREHDK